MNQMKQTNDAIEVLKVTKQRKKYLVEITPYKEFSDQETFTENQMVENRIFKGQVFLISTWKEILKNKNANDLFDKTLNYLSYGLKTKKEIIDYLSNHNVTEEEIKIIIEKLENYHMLDDKIYTKHFLDKVINNKKGPIYFKNELKNKGVDPLIIEEIINNYDDETINQNIKHLINKELPSLKTYPIQKQKEKIYQKLLRMGYSASSINYHLRKTEFVSDYQERLSKEIENLLNKGFDDVKVKQKLLAKGYPYQEINYYLTKIKQN